MVALLWGGENRGWRNTQPAARASSGPGPGGGGAGGGGRGGGGGKREVRIIKRGGVKIKRSRKAE